MKSIGNNSEEPLSFDQQNGNRIPNSPSRLKIEYYVAKSEINGNGVFAKFELKAGSQGLAHIIKKIGCEYLYTDLGYYINHSDRPNCVFSTVGNKRIVVAMTDLHVDEEITCDYRVLEDMERPGDWTKMDNLGAIEGFEILKVNKPKWDLKYRLKRRIPLSE